MAGVDLGSIVAHLKLEMNDFNSNLNRAKDAIDSTSNNFRGVEAAGKTFSSVGKFLTAGVTTPVVAIGSSVVKTQAQFQDAMAKVQALSGASGKELTLLENTAKKMGSTTVFSASECADALGYMALAGWDANQSSSALPGVLNLAAASSMDLADASDMVTDYLSAFGMKAGDAGKMADMLAFAQANSNTTTQQLGEAFKNCSVNAKGMGQDMYTTTALLGALSNQGLKGSEAGTALNAVFRDMTNHMKNGQIQIGKTNVALVDSHGNFRDMKDIIADVNKATDGMSESEKQAALSTVFTADSIKAMGILLNTGADEIRGFDGELRNSKGTAGEMANTMNNTLSGALKGLSSAWEGLKLNLIDTNGPLTTLIQKLTELVRWFDGLSPSVKQTITIIGLLVAAVGPVLMILGKFMSSISAIKGGITILSSIFSAVSGVIGGIFSTVITGVYVFITDTLIPAFSALWGMMLAHPIVAIVAAIAALAAGFVYAWNNIDGFKEFWINLWEQVKQKFFECVDLIKSKLQEWGSNLTTFFTQTLPNAWNSMLNWFQQLPAKLQAYLQVAITYVRKWVHDMTEKAKEMGTKFVENVSNFIKNLPEKIAYWLAFAVTKAALWVVNMAKKAKEMGTKFITNAINAIKQLPGKIQTWLTNTINKVTTWVTNMVNKAKQMGTKFLNNVVNAIKQLPGKIQTWLTNTINKVTTWVTNMANKAKTAGQQFLNNVSNMIKQVPGKVQSFLTQTISRVTSFVSQMASKARQAGQRFASNIKSALTSLPGQMASIGRNIIQGLINGIGNAAGALYNKMQSIAKSALNGAKAALGIKSPSRKFRDEVGKWIPEGIAVGINANADSVMQSMENLSNGLVTSISLDDINKSVNIPTFGTNMNNSSNELALLYQLKEAIKGINENEGTGDINITLNIDKFNNQRSQDVRGLMNEMTDIVKGQQLVKNGKRK